MRTEDIILNGLGALVILAMAAMVLYVAYVILSWLYKIIFFKFAYSGTFEVDGTVANMRYTRARTTQAGKATIRHPEKNEVFVETEIGTFDFDSDRLYQRVRIDEKVSLAYQNIYIKPRFWDGDWEHHGYRPISVTNIQDIEVFLNKEKPVNHKPRGY